MSKAKHTPGPWDIAGYNDNGGYPEPVISANINGISCYVAACIPFGQGRSEMLDSNARLISAAPELFEALVELESGSGSSPGANKRFAKARAAIAKARGES